METRVQVSGMSDEQIRRCQFFLVKKKRVCKMYAMKGSPFCGEHTPTTFDLGEDTRIPCPYDGAHTVAKKELDRHLRICNSRPVELSFVSKDVNLATTEEELDTAQDNSATLPMSLNEREALLSKVVPIVRSYVDTFFSLHPIHELSLDTSDHTKEHVQTMAICNAIQLLGSNYLSDHSVIEFGAGKAKLTYEYVSLTKHQHPSHVYLIDRSRPKAKLDRKTENMGPKVSRCVCDLKDIDIARLEIPSDTIVCLGKHVCGCATCFSLLSIQRLLEVCKQKEVIVSMATCCHQICSYDTFCNKNTLRSLGIEKADFNVMCRMTSWAVCNVKSDDVVFENMKKSQIGRLFKSFIDAMRLELLHFMGFDAKYVKYCNESTSPENMLLLAHLTPSECRGKDYVL